jgi:hypothetical protein
MEIRPKKGIGDFSFGMTIEEVVAKLGKPDKIYQDEDDENQLLYQYNKSKLRLTFYQDQDGKLGYIRCSNPKLTYQGKPVISTPIEKVEKEVFGKQVPEWEIEDYDFFVTYVNEEFWIVLNVEYDEVTEVELGVPINEDEEYEW